MRQSALLLCFLLVSVLACGTAQVGDRLILDGKEYSIHSNPLRPYLDSHPEVKIPQGKSICSCNWRGYIATWTIRDHRLLLQDITVDDGDEQVRSVVAALFPGKTEVWAEWFTGHILVPDGKIVDYVHMGYASTYEKYIILRVEKGMVTRQWKAKRKDFENFRAAQFTAFKRSAAFQKALDQMRQYAAQEKRDFDLADAEEFIRQFYSEEYLSAVYDSASAPPQP